MGGHAGCGKSVTIIKSMSTIGSKYLETGGPSGLCAASIRGSTFNTLFSIPPKNKFKMDQLKEGSDKLKKL